MTEREKSHGFLLIVGTRVLVTGTRHHGFRGEVVPKSEGMSERALAVRLDEWPDQTFTFYLHNLIPDYDDPRPAL